MMYLIIVLMITLLGGLIWLQRKQEREWFAEIQKKPLVYTQPIATEYTRNAIHADDTIEIIDDTNDSPISSTTSHINDETTEFLLDDEFNNAEIDSLPNPTSLPTIDSEETETMAVSASVIDETTIDILDNEITSHPSNSSSQSNQNMFDDFFDVAQNNTDALMSFESTQHNINNAENTKALSTAPTPSTFPFELIDETPTSVMQPETTGVTETSITNDVFADDSFDDDLLEGIQTITPVSAQTEEMEVITLEDAARNLLNAHPNITTTSAPSYQDEHHFTVATEENNYLTDEKIRSNNNFQAALTEDVPLETITLDDPALDRVRRRTLDELAELETESNETPFLDDTVSSLTAPSPIISNPEFTEIRLPEPSGELETIDLENIQESLSRQRIARLHHQQTVEQSLKNDPFTDLNIIPDNEVWANLANTQTAAERKRQEQESGLHFIKPQANRLSHAEMNLGFQAASATSVAIAEAPALPLSPIPAPEIMDAVSFDNALRPEDFAVDFFTNAGTQKIKPNISFVAQTKNQASYSPTEEDDSPFTEADFEQYYQETASAKEQQQEISETFTDDIGNPERQPENTIPPLSLLLPSEHNPAAVQSQDALDKNKRIIEEKLAEFKVKVNVVDAYSGPVITRYEIEPDTGVRGSAVINLEKDLARSLGVAAIRVVETIPGKTCMGLELPNPNRQMIRLSEILNSPAFANSQSNLTLALGQDITSEPVVTDLAKAPHLLVAGTTGSGKSVGVNAMILSMLYKASPEDVRMIMIDPKMLELSIYEGIPHLLAPVVTDMKLAANALNWCVNEMEKRYRLMSHVGVRNLAGYNDKIQAAEAKGKKIPNPFSFTPNDPEPLEKLPFIVVVVDEFADLMMIAGKQIEQLIARLAQKARAAGIHLILATQRPSVDVITGLIKANIPTRIAFQVSSKIDSRTILDQMGAENLLGQGDMLFLPPGTSYPQRVHGAFVTDNEVHAIVEYLKQFGEPDYIDEILIPETEEYGVTSSASGERDPLFDQAVEIILRTKKTSISSLQRQLRVGYNKAATIIEQMEDEGIISKPDHTGKRTILARSGD
ncbi:cell division protein FtsK [Wielerella bovis]|uniref:DNA translocase FtsK n=1 Tax=Wielerella bovis TaxID=2917790 RepID=UPI002018DF59|nr:DNA translocase FtsK [Wielerella bovis]ULJ68587.1 cell division protein FtsK [Wielerella bovis]